MTSFGFSSRLAPAVAAALLLLATGCSGVTAFQGNMAVAATPPPPPPPAPVPPPPPPVVEKVEAPKNVEVVGNHIEIHQKIQFEVSKAIIKPESFPLLAEIADVIKKNPQIKKLMVEGHSSAEGDAAMNQRLSDDRAKSVRQHLVDKGGVAAGILAAKGYGETKPLMSNDTDAGKEKNRRVEFLITDPAGPPGGTVAAPAPATPPATPAVKTAPAGASMKAPKAGKGK